MQVLQSRYLRSCDVNDIETGPLNTYSTTVPAPPAGMGTRRLARRLLQDTTQDTTQESGVILRVTVLTNTLRVESEVRTVADGVSSGSLASDLTMALGTPVTNVTFTQQPTTMPYNTLPDPNANTGGSLPGWIIGTIVGAILVLMPIPAYILYKRHKRKHLEALEKQQAEAAAARQRMQSRIIKSGGKSFTRQGTNGLDAHDIYALGGPLGSPYGPGSVAANSRQNSMTGVNPMLGARTNSFASPQRLLYQQNSLGPGGMPAPPSPSRTHSRTPSFAHARQHSGAVFPIRYSDEASTSSGNISEPNEKMRH